MKDRVILIICILSVIILSSCSAMDLATAPESTRNPPLYEGAYNVQSNLMPASPVPSKITVFQVNSKPDDVLAYYSKILDGDGWKAIDQTDPNTALFYWTDGCPTFGIRVSAIHTNETETTVELKLSEEPCH